MIIQVDTRQKKNHHKRKEQWFSENGVQTISGKLLVGDYAIPSKMDVVVDTKASISELYSNLIQDHARFHNECVLAKEAGIKLYVLVENKDGIKSADDLRNWNNKSGWARYKNAKKKAEGKGTKSPKPPASNVQLIKIMHSMSRDYGVIFKFCKTEDAGQEIVRILSNVHDI